MSRLQSRIPSASALGVHQMQDLVAELRGIAFNIEHTDPVEYGNIGCSHGRTKLLDDCGATHQKDSRTLNKLADFFEKFFGENSQS